MKIIAISGQIGSGKDTIADVLVRTLGFTKISLADPLKRICRDVYGFTNEQLWGPSHMRNIPDKRYNGLTPRLALQTLGTEWGRNLYHSTWTKYLLHVATELEGDLVKIYTAQKGVHERWESFEVDLPEGPIKGIVVPDVRFLDEVDTFLEAGAILIRVKRPTLDSTDTHRSETEQQQIPDSKFHEVIVNNGTIQDLEHKVLGVIS